MKTKTQIKIAITTIILIMLLLIGLVLIFNAVNSAVSVGGINYQDQVVNENWNGIDTKITSPYIGKLVSGEDYEGAGDYNICWNNDGKITLENNYQISDTFILSSSMDSSDAGCMDLKNYIKSEMTLPPGKLTYSCSTYARGVAGAEVSIKINGQSVCGSGTSSTNPTSSKTNNGEIVIESNKNYKIEIIGGVGIYYGGLSSYGGSITLKFVKDVTEQNSDSSGSSDSSETSDASGISTGTQETETNSTITEDKKNLIKYISLGLVIIFIIIIVILILKIKK